MIQGDKRHIDKLTTIKGRDTVGSYSLRITPTMEDRCRMHKIRGLTTGLGLMAFVKNLLEINELLDVHRKMADTEMARQLCLEFPHSRNVQRLLNGKIVFGYFRSLYNYGTITGKKPIIKSRRYVQGNYRGGKPRRDMMMLANSRTGTPLEGSELLQVQLEIEEERKKARELGMPEPHTPGWRAGHVTTTDQKARRQKRYIRKKKEQNGNLQCNGGDPQRL